MDNDLYPKPSNMPADHTPDYDTFTLQYPDGQRAAVRATLGLEIRKGNGADDIDVLKSLFSSDDGPLVVERGRVIPSRNRNSAAAAQELFFAYWSDEDVYLRWLKSPDVRDFFENQTALETDVGRWRETGIISIKHHETNYSQDAQLTGLAKLPGVNRDKCVICGYWGAARDRIPASADEDLAPYGSLSSSSRKVSLGKHVVVEAAGNFCAIRTSQDWIGASAEHRDWYLQQVEPVLHAGTSFLAAKREEAGTLATRYIRETTLEGDDVDRTCALVYFHSMAALEKWTHTHPTHLAIFQSGIDMVNQFGADLGVRLYHEVTVFPSGSFDAEYANCSPDVGLLEEVVA